MGYSLVRKLLQWRGFFKPSQREGVDILLINAKGRFYLCESEGEMFVCLPRIYYAFLDL